MRLFKFPFKTIILFIAMFFAVNAYASDSRVLVTIHNDTKSALSIMTVYGGCITGRGQVFTTVPPTAQFRAQYSWINTARCRPGQATDAELEAHFQVFTTSGSEVGVITFNRQLRISMKSIPPFTIMLRGQDSDDRVILIKD